MFVITFYSFKGGVGRTMALINVGVQLGIKGKRVLLVDFDLEAPGLPTYHLTAPKTDVNGVVEYISAYREHGAAPDVRDYVYSAFNFDSGGELLVMPAGRHDDSYSQRLNSIDWNHLYEEEQGYLFFEDLRRQWNSVLAPDYVLIDSRTGHSDVEGICTRQLPDSVCLLFFPNEQNLQGLKKVVHNVRVQNETRKGARNSIDLRFVVSNVPDLDDEEGIVGTMLERFQRDLGYTELAGQVHHYNSLSLLTQEVFSQSRPNSRLTKEYRQLTEVLVQDNLRDKDVAVAFLQKCVRDLQSFAGRARARALVEKAELVLSTFPTEPDIALDVALIYEAIGRTTDALTLLGSESCHTAHHWAVRARLDHKAGNRQEAIEDIEHLLKCGSAQAPSLLDALSIASQIFPEAFEILPGSAALASLSDSDKIFVAIEIEGAHSELLAKVAILEDLLPKTSHKATAAHNIAVASIGLGRFSRAIEIYTNPQWSSPDKDIPDAFNLAMAKWGETGAPTRSDFEMVRELDDKRRRVDADVNYLTCMAIVGAVVGDEAWARALIAKARSMMKLRPRREFSPWTYTKVTSREFLEHLSQIEKGIGSSLKPAFLAQLG